MFSLGFWYLINLIIDINQPVLCFLFFQIAGKVAAPLGKTNEIVILSGEGNRITGEVNRLLAELPVTVNALTGVDLSKVKSIR